MKMTNIIVRTVATVGGVTILAALAIARTDWPQWRGPDRTGLSAETGLLKQWPDGGPVLAWKSTGLGLGHATPCVAGGKVYGLGLIGSEEMVWALNEKTGKPIWSMKIADGIRLDAGQGGYGPRSTPTIVGNRLFALGVAGDLVCMDTVSGNIIWRHNLVKEFGGRVPTWGYSESPLVDGSRVIATPGGEKTVVAFDRISGKVEWTGAVPGADPAHYSSAIRTTVGGVPQIVQFTAKGVIGLEASTGKFLWRYDKPANGVANCSTAIAKGEYVFAASGYSTGGGLAHIVSSGGKFNAEEVYFTKQMQNHHGGMVLVGDYLYGFDQSNLTCLEFATGKVMWTDRSVGKGSVSYADGNLIARSENGPIALVEATPTKYVEKGRFDQPDRSRDPSWPYPVVANGRLYIRDMGLLLAYDVKAK